MADGQVVVPDLHTGWRRNVLLRVTDFWLRRADPHGALDRLGGKQRHCHRVLDVALGLSVLYPLAAPPSREGTVSDRSRCEYANEHHAGCPAATPHDFP